MENKSANKSSEWSKHYIRFFVDHIFWTALDESSRATCGEWHYYYTAIGDMMAILNSAINFVIYVLTSPKFRLQIAADVARGPETGECARNGEDFVVSDVRRVYF